MSKALRYLRRTLTVLLVLIGAVILTAGIATRMGHLQLQPVLSGSMRPGLQPGDLAALWKVPDSSLRVGDAIAFYPPGHTVPVLHRIRTLTRTRRDGAVVTAITTKGDANRVADPWGRITLSGTTAYKLLAGLPSLGWLGTLPRDLIIALIAIAIGLLALTHVFTKLFREYPGLNRRRPVTEPSPNRGNSNTEANSHA